MREAIPTGLLLRLMNATPEQFAVIERILGLGTGTNRTDGTNEEDAAGAITRPGESCRDGSVGKLDLDAPQKPPSALTVFRLYCVDGLSADRVARKCHCAKGTVMSRLRFIETVTKTRPEQFRAMAGTLQQFDDDLKASGAREIYRRGLATGKDE